MTVVHSLGIGVNAGISVALARRLLKHTVNRAHMKMHMLVGTGAARATVVGFGQFEALIMVPMAPSRMAMRVFRISGRAWARV